MNKADLIEAVAKASELSKGAATRAVEATIAAMKKSISKGERVQLIGFGSFEVRKRTARIGRNPRTGAALKIKAKKVPAFRAGKALRDSIK